MARRLPVGRRPPVVRTPYLDALAARGTRFSRAYSATPTCVPARAALHTGLSQTSHGRVGYQDGVPWASYRTTLAGQFREAGYQTKCVGKMHVYPERHSDLTPGRPVDPVLPRVREASIAGQESGGPRRRRSVRP